MPLRRKGGSRCSRHCGRKADALARYGTNMLPMDRQAEGADRVMRSVSHQMKAARFPVHRDLAGFDFEVSPVERKLVTTLAGTAFTDDAHNVVLVDGPEYAT